MTPAKVFLRRLSAFLIFINIILAVTAVALAVTGDRKFPSDTPETEAKAQSSTAAEPSINIAEVPSSEIQERETALPEAVSEEPIKLLFGGDVYLSSYVLSSYDKGGIEGNMDESFRALSESADLFFVNEEFPFSERGTAEEDKEFTFRVPPSRVNILKEMGVDGVSLANNHILDFGTEALSDTIVTLKNAGISYTGAGSDRDEAMEAVIFEKNGKRVAILGATRVMPFAGWAAGSGSPGVFAAYDAYKALFLGRIEELSQSCDYVVVYMHWGTERKEEPEDYMRELSREIAAAGADLIVGAHPHVLQGAEYVGDVPVIYSLGNFLFGSSIPKTMLLEADIYPDEERTELRIHPGTSAFGYTKALGSDEERAEFYEYYEGLSYGISLTEGGVIEKAQSEE